MCRVEELWAVRVQIIALRAEMVVDHVEQHHHALGMGRIDEGLEIVRAAVAGRRGKRQHAVISPVARARKRRKWHDLQRGDAQCRQLPQPAAAAPKVPFVGEGADVQFVDHGLGPRPPAPRRFAPLIRCGIDDFARPVHTIGIAARCRIGNRPGSAGLELHLEPVAGARACLGDHQARASLRPTRS